MEWNGIEVDAMRWKYSVLKVDLHYSRLFYGIPSLLKLLSWLYYNFNFQTLATFKSDKEKLPFSLFNNMYIENSFQCCDAI